jgi:alpha-1,2-rhamnosyltransferase
MNTGIALVVRNILRNLPALGQEEAIAVVPVIFRRGSFFVVSAERVLRNRMPESVGNSKEPAKSRWSVGRWISAVRGAASEFLQLASARRIVEFLAAEPSGEHVLLLLDASWAYDIWPAIEDLKARGLRVVSIIYDLIPITHRHTVVESLARAFERWLAGQMRFADGIVCISRSMASVVESHINGQLACAGSDRMIPVSSFYLGSELDFADSREAVQENLLGLKREAGPIFLMVGTIEPRKNHRQVFDAFQSLWMEGLCARLVIAGAQEWRSKELLSEMAGHAEAGRRLLVIRDATDSDLKWLYENATALIMASEVEGFGLPIVEARQMGLPVICSDIAVFRELAAPGTEFFRRGSVDDLTKVIRSHIVSQRPRERSSDGWISWRQSSRQLLDAILVIVRGSKSAI